MIALPEQPCATHWHSHKTHKRTKHRPLSAPLHWLQGFAGAALKESFCPCLHGWGARIQLWHRRLRRVAGGRGDWLWRRKMRRENLRRGVRVPGWGLHWGVAWQEHAWVAALRAVPGSPLLRVGESAPHGRRGRTTPIIRSADRLLAHEWGQLHSNLHLSQTTRGQQLGNVEPKMLAHSTRVLRLQLQSFCHNNGHHGHWRGAMLAPCGRGLPCTIPPCKRQTPPSHDH